MIDLTRRKYIIRTSLKRSRKHAAQQASGLT
jgi:hypothetical protein